MTIIGRPVTGYRALNSWAAKTAEVDGAAVENKFDTVGKRRHTSVV